jgi:predicted dienelactone hydrolase
MKPGLRKNVFLLGLILLALTALTLYAQLALPEPAGPYTVGRMAFHWVDSSRPEEMTENPNDDREVMAWIWYPAEPGTGGDTGYFPGISILSEALAQSGELTWWQVLVLRFVRSQSPLDATPLKGYAPYPVVLFSPGNGTNMEFYSALAGEIASHGYVVVGINHPYDVPAVELSDGSVAPYDRAQWSLDAAAHQSYTRERMKVRVADLLFALDQAESLGTNTDSLFAGILDLENVAVAGHSLGGVAASEACKTDPRFKACLNFDGLQKGGPFSVGETAVPPSQPFLFLTKESQLHPRLLQSFESTSESYWVVVHGASHDSFTDGPVLKPSLLPFPNRSDRLMKLIQDSTLAFLDQTLKGKAADLLSKSTEEAKISVRIFPSD